MEPASLETKNRGHYWACMELVEQVITPDQRKLLQLNTKEQEKVDNFDDVLKIAAYTIEHAAFERMKELDKKTASQLRATISGLGNRYSKYCKENNVPRIKLTENTSTVPPPSGTGSITDFFKSAKTAVVSVLSPRRRGHR